MSTRGLALPWWRWIGSALAAGTGFAAALGWSVIVIAVNGFLWWRAHTTYDTSMIVAAFILFVAQLIGGAGVVAALVLLVWRRTRPLAFGALVGAAVGVGLFLATDDLFRRMAG